MTFPFGKTFPLVVNSKWLIDSVMCLENGKLSKCVGKTIGFSLPCGKTFIALQGHS